MAKELSQEEFDRIMSMVESDGSRYVVIQSRTLTAFLEELAVATPYIRQSNYCGYYCSVILPKF